MKYYSEEKMEPIRLAFEKRVLKWPKVSTKKMFGCPCYQVNKKLFAFLVDQGVVITQLDQLEREALSSKFGAAPFKAGKKVVQNWLRIPLKDKQDLSRILRFVKKSYMAVQ